MFASITTVLCLANTVGHIHLAQETRQAKYKVYEGQTGQKLTSLVPYYYHLVPSSKYLLIAVIRRYILKKKKKKERLNSYGLGFITSSSDSLTFVFQM